MKGLLPMAGKLAGLMLTLTLVVSCAVSGPTQPSRAAGSNTSGGAPVHCAVPSDCFDAATALCHGPWHQLAEPGDAFAAIIGEGSGRYRMVVACGDR